MSRAAHDILRRYQKRRKSWLPGLVSDGELQAYQNWRTAWLIACLEHISVSDQLQNDPYVLKAKHNVTSSSDPRL